MMSGTSAMISMPTQMIQTNGHEARKIVGHRHVGRGALEREQHVAERRRQPADRGHHQEQRPEPDLVELVDA